MSPLSSRPAAAEDFERIWDYLTERDQAAAKHVIATLWDTCLLLSRMPSIGRSRTELAASLRSFPVGSYVIFYRPVEEGEVARILSGAQDIPVLF
jgi:toxin ParE1/3/4